MYANVVNFREKKNRAASPSKASVVSSEYYALPPGISADQAGFVTNPPADAAVIFRRNHPYATTIGAVQDTFQATYIGASCTHVVCDRDRNDNCNFLGMHLVCFDSAQAFQDAKKLANDRSVPYAEAIDFFRAGTKHSGCLIVSYTDMDFRITDQARAAAQTQQWTTVGNSRSRQRVKQPTAVAPYQQQPPSQLQQQQMQRQIQPNLPAPTAAQIAAGAIAQAAAGAASTVPGSTALSVVPPGTSTAQAGAGMMLVSQEERMANMQLEVTANLGAQLAKMLKGAITAEIKPMLLKQKAHAESTTRALDGIT